MYKIVHGQAVDKGGGSNGGVTYPFAFEIIAVPINEDLVKKEERHIASKFIGGAVNYSISPKENKLDGSYEWKEVKKSQGKSYTEDRYASDIEGVLTQRGGFSFYSYYNKTKSKRPCIIAANLVTPKVQYQGKDKRRIDATPFAHVISEAVKKVAKDVESFKDIGIEFEEYAGRSSVNTNTRRSDTRVNRDARITVADIIEELLKPDIQRVKDGQPPRREATQDSLWYNALPLFKKYQDRMIWAKGENTPNRSAFKNQIRVVCDQNGVTREQVGIRAAPWGSIYFEGNWHDISYDSIRTLAGKGTDIVFIEKRDIVQTLGKYADKYGVALVNTHGIISEYTKDLAEFAADSGANTAILTDYDIPGLVIASKLTSRGNVLWLGVNERMLREFGITHDNEDRIVPYRPGKKRISSDKLDELLSDVIVGVEGEEENVVVDVEFLRDEKAEIDAVLAHVGAAKLWDYILKALEKEHPTRDYLRAIEPTPTQPVSDYYPEPIKELLANCEEIATKAIAKESEKIESELEEVEGFIDVKDKRKEIDKRLGDIIEKNSELKEIAAAVQIQNKQGHYGRRKDDGENDVLKEGDK